MRDLMRNYRMILKRKDDDSDTESQPLLSSHSSASSFGALHNENIFPASDSSDYEAQIPKDLPAASPTSKSFVVRRPFCFPTNGDTNTFNVYANGNCFYDRCECFNKMSGVLGDTSQKSISYISYKDYSDLEQPETNGSLVTIFAIWNTIMGSSLLAMAWGLEKTGLIPGIILILFIAGICLYTTYTLLKVNENHGLIGQNCEVSDLCRMLLGKWAEAIANFFSLVVLIGANIVYWILMSNFLYNSVHFLYGYISNSDVIGGANTVICPKEHSTNNTNGSINSSTTFDSVWNLYSTVPVVLAVLMFPLLNFKSPTFFTKFNSLGTVSVAYLLVFISVKAYTWGINVPEWHLEINLKPTFCALSGMLSLAYFIHNIIISIMRNNRNQEKNCRDLSIAFGLVTFTYLFVGVTFYICFPLVKSCIEDNIFNNFEKYDILTIIARLLFLFQLFTVFPLMAFMLRNDILSNINRIFKNYRFGDFTYKRVIVINFFVVLICVLFACFLPKIGTLIRYTGAFSGLFYIFLFPSLLKIASLRKESALTPFKLIIHILIIILGVINLFCQFFIKDN